MCQIPKEITIVFIIFALHRDSNCYKLDGVDDAQEYLDIIRAMDVVGITEQEQVVAAILHLGNINFAEGSEIDSSTVKDEKSRFHLNMTAELLSVTLSIWKML